MASKYFKAYIDEMQIFHVNLCMSNACPTYIHALSTHIYASFLWNQSVLLRFESTSQRVAKVNNNRPAA